MRPHCVMNIVVVKLCIFVYYLSLCVQCFTKDVVMCYLYVTLVVLIMMCTNPYRMERPH